MLGNSLNTLKKAVIIACGVAAMGCAQHHSLSSPDNVPHPFYGQPGNNGTHFEQGSAPKYVFATELECADRQDFAAPLHYRVDRPLALNSNVIPIQDLKTDTKKLAVPLSPGDMVELTIENGEGFNGRYVVDPNGFINFPLLDPIAASGIPVFQVAERVELGLIKANIFKPSTAKVTLQVLHWAGIEVSVSGAVFQPGRVLINNKSARSISGDVLDAVGDFAPKRLLSEAVRAASGVRPDAKIDQVVLIRQGWQVEVDMTGILTGDQVLDYPLISGDRIIVPSTGCFQHHLVRPSQITPKGFRIFMSNLTDSAKSNSPAGVGRYSSNIPYGTRLLQAAVSANCIGGMQWTNAPRMVLLASKHPITGETQVIERSVEHLMRYASREAVNPYLMPSDAIACYDSAVTNLRDVASAITQIVAPFKIL
ncbi:MAG: polysaccharide export protein [Alteromonadaceae bacterium]|nr:polysaccharide export protein [Alteromonadaceae bacterium]